MNPVPREIGGLRVILYTPIDGRHRFTGGCRQVVGGIAFGPAAGLAICQYERDTSFYLFGCDSDWSSVTDTWHETLEEAMSQAESEYEGVSSTWQRND